MSLAEKVILVTGGAGHFGTAIVKSLIELNAIPVSLDLNENPDCFSLNVDLTKADDVLSSIELVSNKFGKIHGLVNNAGIIYNEPLINIMNPDSFRHGFDTFDRYLKINLNSVFYVTVCVAEQMVRKRVKGKIINISSISAQGNAGQTVYSAAKAGIEGLTKTWARELGPFGICVNAIAPGFIDTPSTHHALSQDIIKHIKSNTPLRKLGNVDEITKTIIYLMNSDFVNGEIIQVDGGLTL